MFLVTCINFYFLDKKHRSEIVTTPSSSFSNSTSNDRSVKRTTSCCLDRALEGFSKAYFESILRRNGHGMDDGADPLHFLTDERTSFRTLFCYQPDVQKLDNVLIRKLAGTTQAIGGGSNLILAWITNLNCTNM